MTVLVTGGAGFIGSNFVTEWLALGNEPVVTLDALTYAGNMASLQSVIGRPDHIFVQGNICDRPLLARLFSEHQPRAVIHFAAESHVDRSIEDSSCFVRTNVEGTHSLLEVALSFWTQAEKDLRDTFRFLHVSTDEVFGSLDLDSPAFTEESPYAPNSPYSATKAASDHLVRAWHHSFGLPTLTTQCSNNYGPFQYPEKLIPLIIARALSQQTLPVYGDGRNVRDWLHVTDHCEALRVVLAQGRPGERYNIGGCAEQTNIDLVRTICSILDRVRPRSSGGYAQQIAFVADRPGHDRRYAIDSAKMARELGWSPRHTLSDGLEETVRWYLANDDWLSALAPSASQRRGESPIPKVERVVDA